MRRLLLLLSVPLLLGAAPSRTCTYTSGQIIEPSCVSENENNIFTYLQGGVDTYSDGTILSADISNGTIAAVDIADSAVTSAIILDAAIVNADINGSAAIALSKLASCSSAQLILGNASGVPTCTTMGTDATISNAGALTIAANAVALSTDTTGNYVATVADSGNSTVTVSGSGSEGAAVTLNVVDVNCTGCLTLTEMAATLTAADSDLFDLDAINVSSATEGLLLPQNTSCASGTAEGQICWDTDGDVLMVGTGSASAQVGPARLITFGATTSFTSAANGYCSPIGCDATTEGNVDFWALRAAHTAKNMHCSVNAAPGAGTSWTVTLRDDGAGTTLTCQIANTDTTCSDTTNAPSVAAGSLLTVIFDPDGGVANTTGQACTIEFAP